MTPISRIIHLADYHPHPRNYNRHSATQVERIAKSLQKFGQVRSVVVWRNFFLAGHGVREAALSLGWDSLRADVLPDEYDETLALAYVAADNELARMSDPDQEQISAILSEIKAFDEELLQATGFSNDEFDRLLAAVGGLDSGDSSDAKPQVDKVEDVVSADVPDALWASDNDWGLPLLDINLQATCLDQPWAIWGSIGRKSRMSGTWLFYTEDYRYETLWADPSPLLNTGCISAVEPNFSCYENMPRAVALWQIYRKRWIARWWQSYGVRIFVDLNVATIHYDLNLLGIPLGWKAFATRGYVERIDDIHSEYAQAKCIAGNDVTPLFVVYGGGKAIKEECQRNGWIWLKENMDSGKGKEV